MMRRFCAYIEKVFDFSRHVSGFVDARQRPRITTAAVWLSGFLMAVMRAGSLNAIGGALRVPHHFESLIGSRKPSADTIARVFARMAAAALRGVLCVVNHQLKRNKLLTLRWPLRFAALDGHEFFSLTKALLPAVLPAPHYRQWRGSDRVLPRGRRLLSCRLRDTDPVGCRADRTW